MSLNSYQGISTDSGLPSAEDMLFFFSDRPFKIEKEMEILFFSLALIPVNF